MKTENKIKTTVLVILDGFGLPNADPSLKNSILEAKTPYFDELFASYPHAILHTSGSSVGLPQDQMGNSEIGHMNIGSGRVMYSDLVKISREFSSKEFGQNTVFQKQMNTLKKTKKNLHLMGLLSDGGVHSHIDHLKELIQVCREKNDHGSIYIHAFLDGRDTPPNSGIQFVEDIQNFIKDIPHTCLASIIGRYYAMDRDKRWERIRKAYQLLVEGEGASSDKPLAIIQSFYAQGITDEFMEPIITESSGRLQEKDAVIFFNFRADRARQLCHALTNFSLTKKEGVVDISKKPRDLELDFSCLTEYDENLNLPVLLTSERPSNTLGQVISQNRLKQLRLAETEKYAHVTFFFNGGEEKPFDNEERILVPSPRIATYDLKPEMSAFEVKDELIKSIRSGEYSLIVVNFANGDMVGHTGKLEASIKAVEALDSCIGEVTREIITHDAQMLITADHGNCEQMLAEDRKTPFTQHTIGPVPLIYVSKEVPKGFFLKDGKLADIAPTILVMLGLEIPPEMTGEVLTGYDKFP